jgi:hypothetical protein
VETLETIVKEKVSYHITFIIAIQFGTIARGVARRV